MCAIVRKWAPATFGRNLRIWRINFSSRPAENADSHHQVQHYAFKHDASCCWSVSSSHSKVCTRVSKSKPSSRGIVARRGRCTPQLVLPAHTSRGGVHYCQLFPRISAHPSIMSRQPHHRYPTRSSINNSSSAPPPRTPPMETRRPSQPPDDTGRRLSPPQSDDDSILQQIYYGDTEGSYSGVNALYEAAHRADPSITMKQTRDFLRQQDVCSEWSHTSFSSHTLRWREVCAHYRYMEYFEDKPTIAPARSHQMSAPGQLVSMLISIGFPQSLGAMVADADRSRSRLTLCMRLV